VKGKVNRYIGTGGWSGECDFGRKIEAVDAQKQRVFAIIKKNREKLAP